MRVYVLTYSTFIEIFNELCFVLFAAVTGRPCRTTSSGAAGKRLPSAANSAASLSSTVRRLG